MSMDEFDEEDEGWIWLPWEEIQELQRQKNKWMNDLLDNMALKT